MSRVKERHGVANVRLASCISLTQNVTVVDGDEEVCLHLSNTAYGACMTPDEADMLGRQLMAAAARVRTSPEAKKSSPARAAGGHAAAEKLTPAQRSQRAKKAAQGRWHKDEVKEAT